MALAVLAGRGADFFDKEVDEASAGGIADLLCNLGNRHACREQEGLGVLDAGVDQLCFSQDHRMRTPADHFRSVQYPGLQESRPAVPLLPNDSHACCHDRLYLVYGDHTDSRKKVLLKKA